MKRINRGDRRLIRAGRAWRQSVALPQPAAADQSGGPPAVPYQVVAETLWAANLAMTQSLNLDTILSLYRRPDPILARRAADHSRSAAGHGDG